MSVLDTPFTHQGATASDTEVIREVPETATTGVISEAAAIRDEVGILDADATDLHRRAQLLEVDQRTAQVGMQEPRELLDALGVEWGLSWAGIARLLHVSETAIRKWRRGDQITPENRRRLARLVSMLEMLKASKYPVNDPASWLEMRVSDDATVTPVDLYAANRIDLIFELAGRRKSSHDVLAEFDPEWRSTYAVDQRFTVVDAADGHKAIVMRRSTE
jgi:hypothetical protein